MKHSYSQLVADMDYLLEWGSTCYERKEEVAKLTRELEVTVDSLQYTQLALQESQSQLDKATMELEQVQLMLAPDLVQLKIVVGSEFGSTVEDEGCDDVANTFIQDMSVVCTEEVRASVEIGSHANLLPPTGSEYISPFHTVGSIK